MIPDHIKEFCKQQGYGEILSAHPVSGGCINKGAIINTASGKSFFLKTNPNTPLDMFAREAEGLETLSVDGGPRVPNVILYGEDFLLLEDLAPVGRKKDYWETFGSQLATLHNDVNDNFGFFHDNYIGSTPQPNSWMSDGYLFFMEKRLKFQAQLSSERGLLRRDEVSKVEKLGRRLPDLIPQQPASLIHGDLWSGNAITDSNGMPAIIDPAAHYGWAEAELAMTTLFISFPESFFRSYQEVRLIEVGYRERFPIYNLYHLLNHLNLFGSGYHGQVLNILNRYV